MAVTIVGWGLALVVQFHWFRSSFDIDYGIYMHAVDHWLATGEWYADRQLHGPYPIELGDVLYPPDLLYLLVPFRLLGPAPWTIIPIVPDRRRRRCAIGRRCGRGCSSRSAWRGR